MNSRTRSALHNAVLDYKSDADAAPRNIHISRLLADVTALLQPVVVVPLPGQDCGCARALVP